MTEEPASLILELLRQMRAELGDVRAQLGDVRSDLEIRADFATKSDLSTLRADIASDMHSLRAHVASDMLSLRKEELSEQIVGLRRAVIEYHTSVVGHGVLISGLEERMRRVEQHLNLPSLYPDVKAGSATSRPCSPRPEPPRAASRPF